MVKKVILTDEKIICFLLLVDASGGLSLELRIVFVGVESVIMSCKLR